VIVLAPSGTVTFLFTDIEGSTGLWESHPGAMRTALEMHDAILRDIVDSHGGYVFATGGDGVCAAFARAGQAVEAAVEAQERLTSFDWRPEVVLRVRMGLHTGEVTERDGDYFGPAVNRAARLMAIAHGGQVLVFRATQELLSPEVSLVDVGDHRLRDLAQPEHVFQVCSPSLPSSFPALRSLDTYPTNLPAQLTTFIGRDHLLAEIAAVLEEARVVTLTGVGGVGKTRLALQIAADVVPRYREGAWLVELAPIVEAETVVEVIATTLGVTQRQGQSVRESVTDFLRAKRILLIIDNCEHLLDAAARFIDGIVRACPHVSVIATSREGLGVVGERMIAVPSLELPQLGDVRDSHATASTEAVRLFVERARGASAGFAATDDNRDAIVRLCRRLDGIPLAIELAAARVRSLTPAELADRLDARFRLLAGGPRTAVERHQTLRRAIDWSYDLLSATEQVALNRLAVFAGSFTLDAAEAVIVDEAKDPLEVIDVLGHLVDKSLLLVEHSGHVSRYRLLETIRQYAEERLETSGEADGYRHRHADYYASFAAEAGDGLRGRNEVNWTTRAEAELDNIRAALAWAQTTGDARLALRLISPLALNGTRVGYATGPWAESILDLPGARDDPLFFEVQAWAGWAATISGDNDAGIRLVEDAVKGAEGARVDDASMCRVLCSATGVLSSAGRMEDAGPLARRWAECARAISDDYGLSQALIMVGMPLAFSGDLAGALVSLDKAVETARRLGNPTAITYATMTAGLVRTEAEPERALGLLDEALDQATSVGNNLGIGLVLSTSANLHLNLGAWAEAARLMVRSIKHFHQIGDVSFFKGQLHPAVVVLESAHADESAAVIYGATPIGRGEYGGEDLSDAPWVNRFYQAIDTLRTRLGDDRFAASVARGSIMDDGDVVAFFRDEVDRLLSTSSQ
jgi:predicted ATPase/class 3 adenylate cyclase